MAIQGLQEPWAARAEEGARCDDDEARSYDDKRSCHEDRECGAEARGIRAAGIPEGDAARSVQLYVRDDAGWRVDGRKGPPKTTPQLSWGAIPVTTS